MSKRSSFDSSANLSGTFESNSSKRSRVVLPHLFPYTLGDAIEASSDITDEFIAQFVGDIPDNEIIAPEAWYRLFVPIPTFEEVMSSAPVSRPKYYDQTEFKDELASMVQRVERQTKLRDSLTDFFFQDIPEVDEENDPFFIAETWNDDQLYLAAMDLPTVAPVVVTKPKTPPQVLIAPTQVLVPAPQVLVKAPVVRQIPAPVASGTVGTSQKRMIMRPGSFVKSLISNSNALAAGQSSQPPTILVTGPSGIPKPPQKGTISKPSGTPSGPSPATKSNTPSSKQATGRIIAPSSATRPKQPATKPKVAKSRMAAPTASEMLGLPSTSGSVTSGIPSLRKPSDLPTPTISKISPAGSQSTQAGSSNLPPPGTRPPSRMAPPTSRGMRPPTPSVNQSSTSVNQSTTSINQSAASANQSGASANQSANRTRMSGIPRLAKKK